MTEKTFEYEFDESCVIAFRFEKKIQRFVVSIQACDEETHRRKFALHNQPIETRSSQHLQKKLLKDPLLFDRRSDTGRIFNYYYKRATVQGSSQKKFSKSTTPKERVFSPPVQSELSLNQDKEESKIKHEITFSKGNSVRKIIKKEKSGEENCGE